MSGNLVFGQDRTTNSIHALACDSDGHLDVNIASATGTHGLATEAKQDEMIADLTDGTQKSQVLGNTQGDGSGDSYHLHVDSNGNAKTTVVNAVSIMPHSETNSGITDDPRDSVAVGLRARTTITDASTETFLLCDSDGHLQVDVLSGGGGGGDATAANQSLQLAQETVIATNSSSIDNKMSQGSDATLTNAQQVLVYGRDSGGVLDALKTDASGHLEVVVDDFVKSQATMSNSFPVVLASDQSRVDVQTNRDEVTITQSAVAVTSPNTFNSTSVDMRGYSVVTFLGNSTNSIDMISIQYSIDDTTFYDGSDNVLQNMNGDFHITIPETGARYVRLQQKTVDSAANMTITCISSKK